MRVVADTNTVVSAFLWGGPPKAVLDAARDEHITLFSSAALLAEFEDVMSRDKFAARIERIESTQATLLRLYRALITLVRPIAIAPPAAIRTMITCSPARLARAPRSSSAATKTSWIWVPSRGSSFFPPPPHSTSFAIS
jgi:putative PIN family toxin of toxin-antitoxin system